MRRLGLALLLVLFARPAWAACTGASPTWTSTPDYASVAACVAGATAGDTINVTAGDGTETWSSTLTLTQGVWLKGPGRDSLVITRTGVAIVIDPTATAVSNSEVFKVSGFTFDGNNGTSHIIEAYGPSPESLGASWLPTASVFRQLVIIDNRLRNITGGAYNFAIYVKGQVRGVIGGNIFDRCSALLGVFGGEGGTLGTAFDVWKALASTRAYGNNDSLFLEDNTVLFSSAFAIDDPAWIEIGQSGRVVIRYNSWNMANCSGGGVRPEWDIHGMQNWEGGSGQTGTMIAEYYGNTITAAAGYRWANIRGGWTLIHNNLWDGSGTPAFQIVNYGGDDRWTGQPGQPANTYVWNVTNNGTTWPIAASDDYLDRHPTSIQPVPNQDFYNYNAAFATSGQHGIGRGTTVTSATGKEAPHNDVNGLPIDGDAYWVATTATPTVDSTVIQAGRLYKYISGSWQVYYAPYTYPHPLRSVTAPNAPTNVRIR